MITLRSDSIGNQLNRCRVAIQNTIKSPDILALVGAKGYPLSVMNEGQTFCNAANSAVNDATEKAGALSLGNQHAAESFAAAQNAFQDLAKTARAVFLRNAAVRSLLGLDQKMPRAAGDFTRAFNKLFNTGAYTPEIRAKLLAKGYTDAKLSLDRSKLSEWAFAVENQSACDGAAQEATVAQTTAIKALVDWVAEYLKIARVALKQQPQLLEKIGVLVRANKTKAQRAAPAKAAATRKRKRQQPPPPGLNAMAA